MNDPRGRAYKGGLTTLARGKLTVGAFYRDSEKTVELRVHDARGRTQEAVLSLPQALEALRYLSGAVAALEAIARHDGSLCSSVPREGAAESPTDEQAG
ncbi:hypothetical protein MEX01_16590 [Methylorubrum extorquens]|uniref:hypothetical protein n=1 Tax=Methylorubrum extorquens TaxID=408 RepID=UPI00116BD1AD|nr:hypothetical protein [Methylorubrum extorquens]GEL41068.1 hypothetical protein MEX01_16590 [Methylorubrum extorquens]